jgi:flagellar basal body-associated protein FliL
MESDSKDAPAKARGSSKLILLVVVVLVIAAGSAAGSIVYMSRMLPSAQAGARPASRAAVEETPSSEHSSEGEGAPGVAMAIEGLIVDVKHGSTGEIHHLKVGLSVEIAARIPEEELKHLTPRVRDAAITYLRSLTLEEVTDAAKFDDLRRELRERVAKALGRIKVGKVLFTDFVAQ